MILSSHLKHSVTVICTSIVFLLAGWFVLRHIISQQPQGVYLRPQDKEHIIYNAASHMLTVTTVKGTTASYTRNPDILIEKNGAVIVKKHELAFEKAPFIALGGSFDGVTFKKNGYIGLNMIEAWRFDLGPALAIGQIGVRPLFQGQYNIVANTSIMAGWWFGTYHAAIAVRF